MFIGNQFAQQIINKLFDKIKIDNKVSIPFLLISGPEHIGKKTLIFEKIKDLLGKYFLQDFLYIKDFSEEIGKKHYINIEKSNGEISDLLYKDFNYNNIGIREVNKWLGQSSLTGWKVVLIENIERMTIGATNALLKTCEEPLDGRLIIGTTTSTKFLLDTIVSRAFVINMQLLGKEDMLKLAKLKFKNKKPDEIQELINISMGKPGILCKMTNNDFYEKYINFIKMANQVIKLDLLSDKFILLKKIWKDYNLNLFLDYIISRDDLEDIKIIKNITDIKKKINSNVNKESLILKLSQLLNN